MKKILEKVSLRRTMLKLYLHSPPRIQKTIAKRGVKRLVEHKKAQLFKMIKG